MLQEKSYMLLFLAIFCFPEFLSERIAFLWLCIRLSSKISKIKTHYKLISKIVVVFLK